MTDLHLSDREFERIVRRVIEGIPDEIMRHVENVAIMVEDRPSPELLRDMGLSAHEPLLGVYTGVALPERSVTWPEFLPDAIILFKDPLLEICGSIDELEEEIETTVVHEIAHYFGISEDRLAELGYG